MRLFRPVPSLAILLITLALGACQGTTQSTATGEPATTGDALAVQGEARVLTLPQLAPAREAQNGPLQVAATTSIIGDVVARVGGEAIALTTLMAPGQDPHSYEPSTADLTQVAEADVIFVNGWDLEEGLADDLANVAGDAPLVPISADIEPLIFGAHEEHEEGHDEAHDEEHEDEHLEEHEAIHDEDAEHEHGGPDPHVWMDPQLVRQWVHNVETVLSSLDPGNAGVFAANAAAYLEELAALDATMEQALGQIPPRQRKLVTNHDALAYFARRFDFEVLGTVIPAASTVAEPSAQEMVSLVQRMRAEGVCTIFAETTASARLAETVAAELGSCDEVQVLSLYTGALGAPGSGAESYLDMMWVNTEMVVEGLGGVEISD